MPYGPALPDGVTEDDHRERGLIFVCRNASISRQFESIQRQWLAAIVAGGAGDGSVAG